MRDSIVLMACNGFATNFGSIGVELYDDIEGFSE